jgi:hypothetical protein
MLQYIQYEPTMLNVTDERQYHQCSGTLLGQQKEVVNGEPKLQTLKETDII